jgi:uncharacterized protein YjbI with pentapeptide repeats
VTTDPKDLGELQKALNDVAGKASVLWTTFVTFQLYLAIAFGSVTHRDLFLETPIKLPLLNVDLPLVGFFVVAPMVLVLFHFYVFLQLLGLATKAKDYNTLLASEAPVASDRQYLRQRLDAFPILQFLAGPRDQRTGFRGFSLGLMAWITLVGTPILILLQGQVTFLPYHREWIVWLQRVAVLIDLALIWYFWINLRSDGDPINEVLRKAWMCLGGAGTLCVVIFSIDLALFPAEWVDEHLPDFYVPTTWRPHWSEKDDWKSLYALLFQGAVDEVSGRPRSVFSSRLVLTDQSFVDPDKLDKVDVTRSFRGRDLRQAVLNGADLRKADFTGAMLNGARLERAKLGKALFGCALTGRETEGYIPPGGSLPAGCTWLQGARLEWAELQGASLERAELRGASLIGAHLQGASLERAELQGALLVLAQLQRARLDGAQLQGASLVGAQLQGASLDKAQLQGASLDPAHLQGASLDEAQLQGASLIGAELQGARLSGAQLQGASLDKAQLQGAGLVNVLAWRAFGTPNLYLADLLNIDAHQKPWKDDDTFTEWRDAIADSVPEGFLRDQVIERLAVLDPEKEPQDVLDQHYWDEAQSSKLQGEEVPRKRAMFLADLACLGDSAPYVARGLLRNLKPKGDPEKFLDAGGLKLFTDRLLKGKSDPTTCPGTRGLTDTDWADLSKWRPD